ncbi:MAG: hypothetical protein E6G47_00395 [Actinobacteria bacterium]|nr:MAG: hypothetical protein E6G47_00395 [Actinomycetota bacterium]
MHPQWRLRMRRPMLALVLLVALAVVGLPAGVHAQKSFKVGAIVPVSGPAAAFGLGVQRGLELAAEDVGVFAVAGEKYKLEVVTYDTVYAPDKTVAAINRAVYNDNVKYGVIIGAGVHPPILPIIRETGFLDFAFAAAGRQITNPDNPTAFRIMASSDQLYRELIDHGILLAPTGLGCLSTAVGEAEIEYFLEVLNACIHNGDSA